jgi:hypothetical protein
MPTLEALDYERFSYDEANQHPLTLDEAVKKAAESRRKDSTNFYRIVHVDDGRTTFVVKKVPVASVYADFMTRVAKVVGRHLLHSKAR